MQGTPKSSIRDKKKGEKEKGKPSIEIKYGRMAEERKGDH
jgi:hypothetical protein